MNYKVVLTIAGSDSCGGAGIQADVKTMSALGVYAATAITAVTAQNTCGVAAVEGISPNVVAAQIDAVFTDMHPDAVKLGMLFSEEIVNAVADRLAAHRANNVVLDPVMVSTSGCKLIADGAIEAVKRRLFPLADVVTPNRQEAELIAGFPLTDIHSFDQAARVLFDMGCRNVLFKGGHFDSKYMTDRLYSADGCFMSIAGNRIPTTNTHGTGCTLSSAIASFLALGCNIAEAVDKAKQYVQAAIEAGAQVAIGNGNGPLNHFFSPKKLIIK